MGWPAHTRFPARPEGDPERRARKGAVTPQKLARFLQYIAEHKGSGIGVAARASGLTRKQMRDLLAEDPEFHELYLRARGWNVDEVEGTLFSIATDRDHPAVERAIGKVLTAYRPEYAAKAELKVDGTVRVEHAGTDVDELRRILTDAGAFEVVDGEAVEDAEVVGPLPGPSALLPARPARERETGGLPPLP